MGDWNLLRDFVSGILIQELLQALLGLTMDASLLLLVDGAVVVLDYDAVVVLDDDAVDVLDVSTLSGARLPSPRLQSPCDFLSLC